MSWPNVIKKLEAGESVTLKPKGQSMTPRITSGQAVTIVPRGETEIDVGMVVLAKVKGKYFLHLVSATRFGQTKSREALDVNNVQISNNHGHVNGWTSITKIYGIAQV